MSASPSAPGTDVAMESADVVLMKSDPYDVVGAIELSRATLRKMHQNLWWAVGYNVIAFPLAAGVFYPFLLSPEIAALAMSGSSALVAINALMLKRTRLAGITRRSSSTPMPALRGGGDRVSQETDRGPLYWRALSALLLAMFAVTVGYGIVLPILPFLIERLAGTADTATLSRHTGLLTGTYTLALFLFAPLWGRVSDRRGRRPVILLGLIGFAHDLALFAARGEPAVALSRPLSQRRFRGRDRARGLCSRRRSRAVEGVARPPLRAAQHRRHGGFLRRTDARRPRLARRGTVR